MKQFLLVIALVCGTGRAQQDGIVHDCNVEGNVDKTFVPWKAWQLSTKECTRGRDYKPGSCASENDCLTGTQGETVAPESTVPKNTCKIEGAASASQCCVMKYNCTAAPAFTSTGGNSRSGTCIQPSFCSNAASKKTSSSACNSNSQLTCCVEEDPQSEGVQCTKRYPVVFNRIVKVQQKLDTDLNDRTSMSSNRITNFLPFAMKTFEDLRANKRCAPLGDCAAASYLAFFYHLLLDFTTPNPTPVLNEILSTLQRTAPAASDKLSNLLAKPEYSGHITPEAFGKMLEILWSDEQLNLLQYNSGSCADWIRISDAVRGSNSPWRCDKRWYYLTAAQYCRPTYTSNLADCGGGTGVCYLNGDPSDQVCSSVGLEQLTSSNGECQNLYKGDLRMSCCRKPKTTATSMVFAHNKYENVRVAIDPAVAESADVLVQLKSTLTKASSMLYTATGQRATFGSVRIILPNTWSPALATEKRSDEKLTTAEFTLKPDVSLEDDGIYSHRVTMHTLQLGYCGSRGFGTFLSPKDLRGNLAAANLVKHFSFNRYGVFREFPRNEFEMEPFDALNDPPPRCAKDNGTSYVYCNGDMEVVVENSRQVNASLIWLPDYSNYPNLEHITHFCDSRSCDPASHHNDEIDNTHNRLCSKRPAMDVILGNDDFFGSGTPPRPGLSTVPQFHVAHEMFKSENDDNGDKPAKNRTTRLVLVLDQSGSMIIDNRMDHLKTAAAHIVDMIGANIEMAVVSFDWTVYVRSTFRRGDAQGKLDLKNAIYSIEPNGATCIQLGLNRAVPLLEETREKGGFIVLLTDGENTCEDYYEASMAAIARQNATVHTVALTFNADKNLQRLAVDTGGLSYLIAKANDVPNFLLQMQSILIESTKDDSTLRVTLRNQGVPVARGQTAFSVPVLLDAGLGDVNLVTAFYDSKTMRSMTGYLVSPSGANNVTCVDIPKFGQINCEIAFKPSFGVWTLRLKSVFPPMVSTSQITVTASATVNTLAFDTFSVSGLILKPTIYLDTPTYFWEKETLLDKSQAMIVTVAYGRLAVIGARVTAVITHENGASWRLQLADDGEGYTKFEGADLYENDGVYSALFNDFVGTGRYSVNLEVIGQLDKTFYTKEVLLGVPRSANYLAQTAAFRQYVEFVRVLSIGMFEVLPSQKQPISRSEREASITKRQSTGQQSSDQNMTPGRVTRFTLLQNTVDEDYAKFTFTWSAVAAQGMAYGHPSFYFLNASTDALEVQGRGDEIEVSPLVDGRLVSSMKILGGGDQTPGMPIMATMRLPLSAWFPGTKVYFAVTAYNSRGPETTMDEGGIPGAPSNVIVARIENVNDGVCYANGSGKCSTS